MPGVDLNVLDRAACAAVDTDLFFADTARETSLAKEICSRCPVRAACLERALRNDEKYGVFGGLDAQERSALRKRVA